MYQYFFSLYQWDYQGDAWKAVGAYRACADAAAAASDWGSAYIISVGVGEGAPWKPATVCRSGLFRDRVGPGWWAIDGPDTLSRTAVWIPVGGVNVARRECQSLVSRPAGWTDRSDSSEHDWTIVWAAATAGLVAAAATEEKDDTESEAPTESEEAEASETGSDNGDEDEHDSVASYSTSTDSAYETEGEDEEDDDCM